MKMWCLLLALAVLLCSGVVALAQTTGDISGRVTGTLGTPLAGATIEATSPSQPGARVTVTAPDGAYRIPAVPPGTYRVAASLSGFPTVERTGTVELGSTITVDLVLRIETEEQVLVSGAAPPIDTTSTTTGTNYTSDVISRLPVNRNYADIVQSNPGVSTDFGDTEGRFLALAIYGATSAENQWAVDGVNTTNVQKGIQGKAINNEFVQEVEVKTGGYQAEYGRALGGVINVITKSGGNAFHGDVFGYYDSTATTARREFRREDSGVGQMRTVESERLDYGSDLGGFILKDRLWFFAAYNRVTLGGDVSRVTSSAFVSSDDRFPFDAVEDLYSGKLTWNARSSTTLVGTMFADPSSTSGAAAADPRQGLSVQVRPIGRPDPSTWYSTRTQGGTDQALRLTELFESRALATLQWSYHREGNTLTADDTIQYVDATCVGGSREAPCQAPSQANSVYGGFGNLGVTGHSSRKQYAASISLFAGDHDVKAGGDYMDGRTNLLQRRSGGQLVTIFNQFGETYYRHQYNAASRTDLTPIASPRGAQVIDYGGYFQDSWRPGGGLTVNAGLRWDGEVTRNYRGEEVIRFDDGWQPRLGVVWDPWRNGETKVHAFAGRFSYALPTTAAWLAFGSLTNVTVFNFDPVSLEQDPTVFGRSTMQISRSAFSSAVEDGVQGAYQDEVTLGVERLLTPAFIVGLKGTYRDLGRAFEDRCDLDYSNPEINSYECAFINPGSSGRYASGRVPTCDRLVEGGQCASPGDPTPPARRLYRGIEFLARHSVRDRAWLQASYVYSSLRGNYDGAVSEGVYNQTIGQARPGITYAFDTKHTWHNSYGALTLDRPHRLRFDGWWVTPLRASVGLQAFVESGAPLNRLGYHPLLGPSVFLVPRGAAGRLPTLWDANLTLSYPVAIGPVTATLQGYLYNVFNNQIVTSRDQAWTTSPPEGYPATIYDPNQERNNPNYGKVTGRSAPRSFRAALRVSF